jgi:hypothetical protein
MASRNAVLSDASIDAVIYKHTRTRTHTGTHIYTRTLPYMRARTHVYTERGRVGGGGENA